MQSLFPEVSTRNAPFTSLFRERRLEGHFDFVYSAGLFDYLDERLARKLTAQMFKMLRPGGSLMLTNFLPTVVDAGYMETFMGWELLYRDLEELWAFAQDIPSDAIAEHRTYKDSMRSIGYLEVIKA